MISHSKTNICYGKGLHFCSPYFFAKVDMIFAPPYKAKDMVEVIGCKRMISCML
jgi:hypothetical protein